MGSKRERRHAEHEVGQLPMTVPRTRDGVILGKIAVDRLRVAPAIAALDLVEEMDIVLHVVAFVEVNKHFPRNFESGKNRTSVGGEDSCRPQYDAFRTAGAAFAEAHDIVAG